jgi:hypothetical protein
MTARSFLEVTLFVADVDQSADFYRAIGVTLFPVDELEYPHHFDGGIGTTVLQLWPANDRPVTRVQLGFRVRSIAEVSRRLADLGIEHNLTGPMVLQTVDPDGSRIHLVQIRNRRCTGVRLG